MSKSWHARTDAAIGFHPVLDDCDCDGDGDARDLQITWTGLEAHDQSTGFGHLILISAIPTAVSSNGKYMVIHQIQIVYLN